MSSRRGAAVLSIVALIAPMAGGLPAPGAVLAAAAQAAAPGHSTVVGVEPTDRTPDIIDGTVFAIHDAGSKVIAAGSFTLAQDRDSDVDLPRAYVLAFDKATGAVDAAFAPAVDNEVTAVIAGPLPGTVYLAGRFNTVNGVTRRKVALVDVASGALVGGFAGPAFNGAVNDLALVGGRLLVGGIFTTAGAANPRGGLASLNATTGALDSYLTTALTVNHNWDGVSGARAGVGAEKLAVSPDGGRLVVIGNFKNADGMPHDQIVRLDLGAGATVADWNTDRYTPRCRWQSFDSYMRDAAFAPDGSYFVVVTTGAPYSGTLCDTAARWEAGATGAGQQPIWVDHTGGDTLLSVAISEQTVYVGGHMRWMNNSLGSDAAQAGAVGRASLAALDPANGLPLAWNPGRHPRGYGVAELVLTPDGLWVGSDQSFIGNFRYRRERIAFFPLAGGAPPHPAHTAGLPGNVYLAGPDPTGALLRINAAGPTVASADGGPDWLADTSTTSPYRNTGSSAAGYPAVGGVDATVPAGTPAAVFSTERWDAAAAPELQWHLPIAAGTEVEVRLYFANRCTCTMLPGQRRFTVLLDGAPVLTNFDVVAATGHDRGTMRAFTVTSDGTVDLDFAHVTENPMVNAIEVVRTGTPPGGTALVARPYDGASTVGPETSVPSDDTAWSTVRGAFWVGGTLFYGVGPALYRRTFDGTDLEPASTVDPYHDAYWDGVETDSGPAGQTYAGSTANFHPELPNVTGAFYSGGRLYYTLTGQTGLFWRWFTPETGAVGAERFTVAGATGFADTGGLFVSGGTLYVINRGTGSLVTLGWTGGAPVGTATVVSGPAIDGVNWRARAIFVAP